MFFEPESPSCRLVIAKLPGFDIVMGMMFTTPLHRVSVLVLSWKDGAGGTGDGPLVPANENTDKSAATSSAPSTFVFFKSKPLVSPACRPLCGLCDRNTSLCRGCASP